MECDKKGGGLRPRLRLKLRLVLVVFALLMTVLPVLSAYVNISIEGYDGTANLTISSPNFTLTRQVKSGDKIEIPEDNYTFSLSALNKTFQKDVSITENTTVKFNLLFTNSTENLSITRHIIVYSSSPASQIDVYDLIIITNSGNRNFEGNLSLPLPDHKNLRIEDATLSFISSDVEDDKIRFIDIIVPANASGEIALSYSLTGSTFRIDGQEQQFMLLSALPVEKYENLSYIGVKEFGGQKYSMFEGNTTHFYMVFSGGGQNWNENPLILAGIFLLSALLFLYLRDRSGRWGDDGG